MSQTQGIGRRQLAILALSSLFVIMYAGPLLRLLPVHASQMGASPTLVGIYLALTYSGLTASTLVAGWLSDRYQRRKTTIIVAGIVAALSLALMSLSDTLWQLSASTVSAWFFGGITFSMITILAGIFAGEDERGKVFGLLAMTMPIANFLAAPVAGLVADRWGYPTLLAGYAVFALSIPSLAVLLEDRVVARQAPAHVDEDVESMRKRSFSMGFYFLVSATFIMAFVGFVVSLGLSLVMHAQAFSSSQIANAVAFGALVSIPLIYLFGWLSDRMPRKWLLALCYLSAGADALILSTASALWQFWIASVLLAVLTAGSSLSNALTTDLVPEHVVGRGLSFTNSARWMGGVVGFALTGYAIEVVGVSAAYMMLLVLVPAAAFMVIRIRRDVEQTHQETDVDRVEDVLPASR